MDKFIFRVSMSNFFTIKTIIVIVFILSGCTAIDINNTQYEGSKVLGIAFFQGASQVSLVQQKNGAVVKIKPEPFNILVPYMYSSIAVQICAFEEYNLFRQFSLRTKLKDIPCYSPGTGLAVRKSKSSGRFNLYLTNGLAHNYFHDSRSTNGTRYRSIGIDSIVEHKDTLSRPVYKGFYMVVYMDKNNNKIMDRNEVEYFFFPERTE